MLNSRLVKYLAAVFAIFMLISIAVIPQTFIRAQGPLPPTASPSVPKLTLDCPYPNLVDFSGQSFTFDVDIKYYAAVTDTKLFNVSVTSIPGWNITTRATTTGKEISAVSITPYGFDTPAIESIQIRLVPTGNIQPDPGDYKTTLKISSDTLTQTMNLVATVKPQYYFFLTESLNTQVTNPSIVINSNGSNTYDFNIVNNGSASVQDLAISTTKPEGWDITFNPGSVASVAAGQTQLITASIKPASGPNVDGDYNITLKAANNSISSTMDVRIRVVTPGFPTWGVMAIIIAAVLVLGVGYHFLMQRRSGPAA